MPSKENGVPYVGPTIANKESAPPVIAHATISRCAVTVASPQNVNTVIDRVYVKQRIAARLRSPGVSVFATINRYAAMAVSPQNASAYMAAPPAR